MKVTSVRIYIFSNPTKAPVTHRGFAEVVFDDQFVVKGLRILEGPTCKP